jgi:hypothetical protein
MPVGTSGLAADAVVDREQATGIVAVLDPGEAGVVVAPERCLPVVLEIVGLRQISGGSPGQGLVVADGPAIYGMFRIISRSRRGAKGAGYGWLLVIAGTMASIGGNVAHAQQDLVARAIAAAIPLAVLAMLEGLKGDAGEATRLAAPAAGLEPAGAFAQPGQIPQPTTVRRPDRTPTPDTPAARAIDAQRRALPAGPRAADTTTVGTRLQAAYARPRPDGQPWTARTLAEAAGCGRSSAASFLQRQRPPAEEHPR